MPLKRAASSTPLKREVDSPVRRSPRKRARVESVKVEDDEDESELTEDDEFKLEEKPSLSKFAYAGPSRPKRTPAKLQVKLEDTDNKASSSTKKGSNLGKKEPGSSSPTKKKPAKQKPIVMELANPHPAPPNWEKQYTLIEEMRATIEAPVDTMGCAKAMTGVGPLKDQRFGALVSLMLSSQTKDEVTAAAVENLRRILPGGLTVDSILAAEPSVVSGAIGKVGFWRRKTEYIQASAKILRDKYDSDVPQTVDELCALPGVGPKMAFLVLQVAWNINAGIGVDIHVHRITNRLGWHKPATTTPEQTRLNLQSWLPRNLHAPINPLLVGFGQIICLPVGPRCDSCLLSAQGLCPSANAKATGKGKKPIVYKAKADLDADGLVTLEDVKLEEDITLENNPVQVTKTERRDVGEPLVQIKIEE
ncbi:endonuclease III [Rhizoctonia solani AG-3 Rhs1AP]|uniref:Endonuclease III homolog n=2 Tax=Rhizoctonia solani AG-3 TaxID=1086053 RepID=A0A074S036_9AGAM|nr:endonuclease III [Rhizoctonia solani AG-3 Rhs1AP]KEP50925.1 endonuclease III [Rhizoctonia solani 123E]